MAMKDEQIRTRAKKKLIRVTFPDGEVICYNRHIQPQKHALVL